MLQKCHTSVIPILKYTRVIQTYTHGAPWDYPPILSGSGVYPQIYNIRKLVRVGHPDAYVITNYDKVVTKSDDIGYLLKNHLQTTKKDSLENNKL